MRRSVPFAIACLLLWPASALLGACQGSAEPAGGGNPYPVDDAASEKDLLTPLPPSGAPRPAAGRASLSGALYSYTIRRLIPDTMFYLAPAQGVNQDAIPFFLAGPDPGQGDLTYWSDPIGNFSLADVPPGNYFLVVSAPYNWALAEISQSDPAPLLLRLTAGDQMALGVLYISWP
jgi:hypothetical protein